EHALDGGQAELQLGSHARVGDLLGAQRALQLGDQQRGRGAWHAARMKVSPGDTARPPAGHPDLPMPYYCLDGTRGFEGLHAAAARRRVAEPARGARDMGFQVTT